MKAVLQQLKDTVANANETIANAQCLIASIEVMLESSNENLQEETPEETPVVNEVSNEVSTVPIIEEEVEELRTTAELEYNEEFPSSAEITEYNEELDMARDAYYFEHKEDPREEVENITLPDPPKEIHIKLPKAKVKTPDAESIMGCQILTALPDFYDGKCSLIKLHKRYFDNGQPKLFIDKYHVVIEAYDSDMNLLGSTVTHWNNLGKFHVELVKRGINTHKGENWMPKVINLDLD